MKANPDDDTLYNAILPRTNSVILRELKIFDNSPSEQSLAKFGKNLSSILETNLYHVAESGYRHGCSQVNETVNELDLHKIRRATRRQAAIAVDHILNTTAKAFGINYSPVTLEAMSKKRASSKQRADVIGKHELRRGFMYGTRMGWARKLSAKKRWFTGTDNPCVWCSDNEAEGPVDINDPFSSGDFEPPLHPNCGCVLMLFE